MMAGAAGRRCRVSRQRRVGRDPCARLQRHTRQPPSPRFAAAGVAAASTHQSSQDPVMNPTSNYLRLRGPRDPRHRVGRRATRRRVIAWHGLARTGRDMDHVAAHLAPALIRVICPDTLGRGLSQWSPDPAREYCLAFYGRIAQALLAQLGTRARPLGPGHLDGRCDRDVSTSRPVPAARPHPAAGAERCRPVGRSRPRCSAS